MHVFLDSHNLPPSPCSTCCFSSFRLALLVAFCFLSRLALLLDSHLLALLRFLLSVLSRLALLLAFQHPLTALLQLLACHRSSLAHISCIPAFSTCWHFLLSYIRISPSLHSSLLPCLQNNVYHSTVALTFTLLPYVVYIPIARPEQYHSLPELVYNTPCARNVHTYLESDAYRLRSELSTIREFVR